MQASPGYLIATILFSGTTPTAWTSTSPGYNGQPYFACWLQGQGSSDPIGSCHLRLTDLSGDGNDSSLPPPFTITASNAFGSRSVPVTIYVQAALVANNLTVGAPQLPAPFLAIMVFDQVSLVADR
jgi:hypothetical protein